MGRHIIVGRTLHRSRSLASAPRGRRYGKNRPISCLQHLPILGGYLLGAAPVVMPGIGHHQRLGTRGEQLTTPHPAMIQVTGRTSGWRTAHHGAKHGPRPADRTQPGMTLADVVEECGPGQDRCGRGVQSPPNGQPPVRDVDPLSAAARTSSARPLTPDTRLPRLARSVSGFWTGAHPPGEPPGDRTWISIPMSTP